VKPVVITFALVAGMIVFLFQAALMIGGFAAAVNPTPQRAVAERPAASSTRVEPTTTAAPTTTLAPTTTTVVPAPPAPSVQPVPQVPLVPQLPKTTTRAPAPPPPAPAPSCDPNYSGCVPIASDVDCAGGSGNGPAYVRGPIRVIGTDIYGLDRDGDGTACE